MVDREAGRGQQQHLPAEGAQREARQQDLHHVEAAVEQHPRPQARAEGHRTEVEEDLHRGHHQQQPGRDAGQVVRRGDEVHQPLVEGELAPGAQRAVGEQDLEASGRPAQLLLRVGLDGVRSVPGGEDVGDVDAAPAALVQHQRRPHVLGLGVGVQAADVVDGRPAEDHVRTDTEGGVEVVPARLDEPVEHGLHVARAAGDEVAQVAVVLRRLDERHSCVGEERHGLDQEPGVGDEVGVEDAEVVGLHLAERVVHVAGLRAAAAEPAQVVHADPRGHVAHVVAAAVVEDVGDVPADHLLGGSRRPLDHVDGFAVARDQQGDTDLASVQQDRGVRVGRRVAEQAPAGLVVGVVARADRAGQDRPHRQQGVDDQDGLGRDHDRPGQEVAPVGRVQEEGRVGQDADGGDQREQDHHRRVGVAGLLSSGRLVRAGDRLEVVGCCHVVPTVWGRASTPGGAPASSLEKQKRRPRS